MTGSLWAAAKSASIMTMDTATSGWAARKLDNLGASHSPPIDGKAPMRIEPAMEPRRSRRMRSIKRLASSAASARRNPSPVIVIARPRREKSATPSPRSRVVMRRDIALWVRPNSRAARVRLPSRTAASKAGSAEST